MHEDQRHAILQAAISTYGGEKQVDETVGKMARLTQRLIRQRCGGAEADWQKRQEDIREKIADVQIMLDQLRLIYGDTAIHEEAELKRLKERVRRDGGTQIFGDCE